MIAIAIAIKLDSKGPIFFRQMRVGRDERRFGVFKFRTMVPEAEQLKHTLVDLNEAQEGLFKIAEDPSRHARRQVSCARPPWTSCPSCSTCCAAR